MLLIGFIQAPNIFTICTPIFGLKKIVILKRIKI